MKSSTHRIIGIDPGYGRIGVGIIEGGGQDWKPLYFCCIETNTKTSFIERLEEVHVALKKIIVQFKPTHAAVEQLFFYKNVKTAIDVGQARGVILLTLRQMRLPVDEFTPLQVKQTITGYGKAEKSQVQKMIKVLLNISQKQLQDDAADALGVALTAGYQLNYQAKLK